VVLRERSSEFMFLVFAWCGVVRCGFGYSLVDMKLLWTKNKQRVVFCWAEGEMGMSATT